MVIILNGSIGVGKTSTSWELMEQFQKSVMLDGDYIGAIHPFSIYDESRLNYLYDTFIHLIKFHRENGYENFVINYVFETTQQLQYLTHKVQHEGLEVQAYWLTCSYDEQAKRIKKRNHDNVEWALNRAKELNDILYKESLIGFIGTKADTTDLTALEVAQRLRR